MNGPILWANLHLLFWLSLIPFVTGWMGENHFAPRPVALYGVVLLMAGIAYFILAQALIRHHGRDSPLAIAIGNDSKGRASLVIYTAAVPMSFASHWLALGLYVLVAMSDRRGVAARASDNGDGTARNWRKTLRVGARPRAAC